MKPLLHILFLLLAFTAGARPHTYDVVIVGGTPAGITAAVAAAREGKNSVILERSDHVGGLPVNGLGATDIATRGATAGLFARFVALNKAHYTEKYGAGSQQARDCSDGYHFEPSVAAETFARMLAEAGPGRITVLTGRQFDAEARYVEKRGDRIVSIRILDRATGREEHYRGAVYIDATYEGDLGAAAGVPFRTGREGAAEYGEPCAGKIYRWWKHGPDAEGTTYEGDDAIQAYNYRLCLTDDPQNRLAIPRPENYDREEYVSLVGDVLDGRNTDARYRTADSAAIARNRRRIEAGERTSAPGDVWGMAKVTSMTRLPNAKMDANNQHLALISTDLPEENQAWPTAGCATTRWACCGSPSTTRRCPRISAKPVCGGVSPPTNTATTADSRVRSTSARAGGWKAAISSPRRTPCPKPKGSARRSTAVRSPRATTPSTRTPCANASRDAYTSTAFSATPRRSTRFPTA